MLPMASLGPNGILIKPHLVALSESDFRLVCLGPKTGSARFNGNQKEETTFVGPQNRRTLVGKGIPAWCGIGVLSRFVWLEIDGFPGFAVLFVPINESLMFPACSGSMGTALFFGLVPPFLGVCREIKRKKQHTH